MRIERAAPPLESPSSFVRTAPVIRHWKDLRKIDPNKSKIANGANKILDIPLIASGGVGTKEHFYEGAEIGQADALLAASVFHFNEISILEVKQFLKKNNIDVRI